MPFVSGRKPDTEETSKQKKLKQRNCLGSDGCNRLKPRGYYGLHRTRPIDLEKYKSDQGTSQK